VDGDLLWILVAVATHLAMWRGGTELEGNWDATFTTVVWAQYLRLVVSGRPRAC